MSVLISIISRKQADLVQRLLGDLKRFCPAEDLEVVVTVNIDEIIPFKETDFLFKLTIIKNKTPKGFGANHNTAFKLTPSHVFIIINPDVRLTQNPSLLFSHLKTDRRIGIIAPLIMNGNHCIEDSARRLPTPVRLIQRILTINKFRKLDYTLDKMFYPDWVAGIFMIFPSDVFSEMKGFDEKYFLYFEDVDLCCRMRLAGYKVVLEPAVSVIHLARRDSHRRLRYLLWHMISGIRFFSSRIFWATLIKE